jgi:hypothetical protein
VRHLPTPRRKVTYCVLKRRAGELYAMNMTLGEEEARRYGSEGETVPVKAIFVWTRPEKLMGFQGFLSATQHDRDSPFRGLIQDMRADRVDALELSAKQLRERLHHYKRQGFVLVDPGPEQRVLKIDEFLKDFVY